MKMMCESQLTENWTTDVFESYEGLHKTGFRHNFSLMLSVSRAKIPLRRKVYKTITYARVYV